VGSGDEKKAEKAQKKASDSLNPKGYRDPYGTFKNGVYTPNLTEGMKAGINNFDTAIGNVSGQIPQSFSINDYYNNPFYETTAELYKAPVLRQYQQDVTALDNSLNARNQLGGSYDATRRRSLDQQRDFQLNQADDQSRLASANAYQQNFSNIMSSLNAALTGRGQLLDQVYAPAKLALGYQQAVAPLQQAQANVYNTAQSAFLSRPTTFDQILNYYSANARAAGSAASGGAV
jgi:hypothetical protein